MLMEQLRWIYRAWIYRLHVERQEIAFLRSHLSAGDTVVDVGAHKGAFTYWMAKRVGPRGQVFAFEPQATLANKLTALVRSRSWSHVVVENLGASSSEGTATLSVPGGKPSPSATLEPYDHGDCETNSVRTVTLDSYFSGRNVPPIKFLKCDVEGHELEVFRGAVKLLRKHKPVLLFECETRHHRDGRLDEVFQFLTGLGYRGEFFLHGKLVSLKNFDAAIHQADPLNIAYANNFVFSASA